MMSHTGTIDNQFVTVAVLRDMLWDFKEDIKDFVRSTIKASETALRNEFKKEFASIRGEIASIRKELAFTQTVIRAVNSDLISRIEDLRTELTAKIEDVRSDMSAMEIRLTNKIENRIKEHESKPVHLAHPA